MGIMNAAIHEVTADSNASRRLNHRSAGLYRGALLALLLTLGLVLAEVLAQRIFVSGFTIIAILVAAAGFFIAGRRVDAL